MRNHDIREFVTKKFDEIMEVYGRDIKARIENASFEEILKMNEEIEFYNALGTFKLDWISIITQEEVEQEQAEVTSNFYGSKEVLL